MSWATQEEQKLESYVYPTDVSKGFAVRLYVLFGVMVLIGVISITNATLHVLAERRRGGSPWLIRVVRRDGGRFFVVDQVLVIALSGVGLAIVAGGGLWTTKQFFVDHRAEDSISWRLSIWAPAFVVSWVVLCSSLGTFLHIIGHRCPQWVFRPVRPHAPSFLNPFNVVALGLGGLLATGLLATMIHGIFDSASLTKAYLATRSFIRSARARGISADDPMVTTTLPRLYAALKDAGDGYKVAYEALLVIFTISSFLLIALSTGSAAFVAVIRRQVLANKAELESSLRSSDQPASTTRPRRASQAPEQVTNQEQRLAALRKVELEHLVITIGALLISVLLLIQSIYTLILLRTESTPRWSATEFSDTFIYYVYGFVVLVGSSLQLLIEMAHFPSSSKRRSSIQVGTLSGGGFAQQTITQQVTVDVQVEVELEVDTEKEADWRTKPRRVSYPAQLASSKSAS